MKAVRLALLLAAALVAPANAEEAPLEFSSSPVLVDGRVPAPNLILAVGGLPDNSSALKSALRHAFGPDRLPNASVRLAWQAAGQCEALPDAGALCQGRNAIQALDIGRRANFETFVEGLGKTQEAQVSAAASLLRQANDFLQRPGLGVHSPWAAIPGVRAEPMLGCRQAHLLLATRDPMKAEGLQNLRVHTAITRGDDVAKAVQVALEIALAESRTLTTRLVTSLAASTHLARTPSAAIYASRYDARRWSGEVATWALTAEAASTNTATWGTRQGSALPHTSASLLDARDPETRVVLGSHGSGADLRGIAWRWDQLAPNQRKALNADDELGAHRLLYLRGERNAEQAQGGPFRDRDSRQADSVNSRLWYAPGTAASTDTSVRPDMLYLGSNGGMLHGFDAATGVERFAYVPQGVVARLAALTQPQYMHHYFVDGSPFTGDVMVEGKQHTWLAGFLGAGGKGYFLLDVSDPAAMTEARATQWVKLDTTADSDPDLGHIFGEPVRERGDPGPTRQITRLNDGRWALVTGNGYNSESQRAVLLIQYLDGARELLKIPAGSPGGNGLSAPRLVDLDGDHVADISYAGDLKGQLWKFELGSRNRSDWKVAFDSRPLFVAQDTEGKRQSITAAPLWLPHPAGGRTIVFGTGRLLTDADRSDTAIQSIYGIHDAPDAGPVAPGRTSLVRQAIDPVPVGTAAGHQLWTSSDHAVPATGSEAKRGWYLDLPTPGERVIANPHWFEGKLIDILSMVPPVVRPDSPESCDPPTGTGFRTTLHALDGARPRSQLYGDSGSALNASRIELHGQPSVAIKSHQRERAIRFDGSAEGASRQRLGFIAKRPSWRHLQ